MAAFDPERVHMARVVADHRIPDLGIVLPRGSQIAVRRYSQGAYVAMVGGYMECLFATSDLEILD